MTKLRDSLNGLTGKVVQEIRHEDGYCDLNVVFTDGSELKIDVDGDCGCFNVNIINPPHIHTWTRVGEDNNPDVNGWIDVLWCRSCGALTHGISNYPYIQWNVTNVILPTGDKS